MTPAARISAAIEILTELETRARPIADVIKEWGRSHRFAGSGDRAAISSLVYDTLRRKASSGYLMGVQLGGVQTWEQLPTGTRIQEALTYPFRYSVFVLQTLVTGGVKQIWQQGSGPVGKSGSIPSSRRS